MANQKSTQYEQAAVAAAVLAARGVPPADAWNAAAREACASWSSAVKACPKNAFLGLAGAGLISGVMPGGYTSSLKNARYATAAVALLRSNAALADQPRLLWQLVTNGEDKQYNQQMHVVTALWKARRFVGQS